MYNKNNLKSNLFAIKSNWAVAELEVNYKPLQSTAVNICCSMDAYSVFKEMWDKSLINLQEQFCVLFMNNSNEVIAFRLISTGSLRESSIDLKLILSCALGCRASCIIIAHNHPSGNLEASYTDIKTTKRIKEACEILNLTLLDHLIISNKGYISFMDKELMFQKHKSD